MSVLEFNDDGNLPEGIHVAEEAELFERFASGSPRRKWLGQGWKELFALAKRTGKLKRAFVWGKFY